MNSTTLIIPCSIFTPAIYKYLPNAFIWYESSGYLVRLPSIMNGDTRMSRTVAVDVVGNSVKIRDNGDNQLIIDTCRKYARNFVRPSRPRVRQGSKWIRPDKRLAIMMRDGFQCQYCGACVEDGIAMTLDHITPVHYYGSNKASNLITACMSCNSRRRDSSITRFLVGNRGHVNIIRTINRQRVKPIKKHRKVAKRMLESRSIATYTGNWRKK